MKNINIIEGQVNLFDLPIQEPDKPKEEKVIYKPIIEVDNFKEIINLYKDSCNRIVKRVSGALLVGFEDKTMYFNKQGINEFNLSPDVGLMPADEIMLVNKNKELNDLQLKKIKDMHASQYIKRLGDSNIIIPMEEKTIVINHKGWVIEYLQKPRYHPDELFITETPNKITDRANKYTKVDTNITDFQIDDLVEIEYEGIKNTGKVVSIYNNGETINVTWDGKHTAFHYKNVKKNIIVESRIGFDADSKLK